MSLKPIDYVNMLRVSMPSAIEIELDEEGGQPNGVGTIEPNTYREWYTVDRESHHRTVITLTFPWEEGPTEYAAKEQEAKKRYLEKVAEIQTQKREARQGELAAAKEEGRQQALAEMQAEMDRLNLRMQYQGDEEEGWDNGN